jgi:hypothetical protein
LAAAAVGAVAEIHLVQVTLEQLVLGVPPFELAGVEQLAELAEHGSFAARVVDLGELLRDRRTALGLAPHRVERRTHHRSRVDPVVSVEVLVLGREHRVLDVLGQVLQRGRFEGAQTVGAEVAEDRTVRGQQA